VDQETAQADEGTEKTEAEIEKQEILEQRKQIHDEAE